MTKQVDIRSASYRVLDSTPGHVRYGVWVNGGKFGNLTVRQEERVGFQEMMDRAGFRFDPDASPYFPDGPLGPAGSKSMYDPHSGEAVEG